MREVLNHTIFYNTLSTVLTFSGIEIKKTHFSLSPENYEQTVKKIASQSRCHPRKLRLTGDWWNMDNGALLGMYREHPCALLPSPRGKGYRLISLHFNSELFIEKEHPPELETDVFYFYPTFISALKRMIEIAKPCIPVIKKDLSGVVKTFLLITFFNLIFPFGMGLFIQNAIAHNDKEMFYQIFFSLVAIGISGMLMQLSQMILTIRIRCKWQLNITPALWDRLLRLPMTFFFKHSTGDIQMRLNAAETLQKLLDYTTIVNFLGGIFSGFSFFILLYFSWMISVATFVATLSGSIVILILNLFLRRYQYHAFPYQRRLYGLVLQMLHGLEKIKSTSAESAIFSRWSELFKEKLAIDARVLKTQQRLKTVIGVINILNIAMLFSFIIILKDKITVADFIIINSAFIYFIYSMLNFFQAGSVLLSMQPYFGFLAPIVKTETEDETPKNSLLYLEGSIELKNVNFRYHHDEAPILRNINMKIKPGERVAIVGKSGSGKTTLLKILLGFLRPDEGFVAYDGINLSHLNPSDIRSHIGVMVQGAKPIPGTIFDNITGGQLHFSRQDAMSIAEKLGFDAMLRDLPMGLETRMDEGVSTFSGGEIQLIKLAGLMAKKPAIIFLDEATSALDNVKQEKIQTFLNSYPNTQFIIAHRLSTIRHADRIYVMEQGKIVEEGTYNELLTLNQHFAALITAEKF